MNDAIDVTGSELLRCPAQDLSFHREKSDDANRDDVVIVEGCGGRVALQCVELRDPPEFTGPRGARRLTASTRYECVDYCVGAFAVSRTCPDPTRAARTKTSAT